MKTETDIAKENIENIKEWKKYKGNSELIGEAKGHLTSCKSFLEFLEKWFRIDTMDNVNECNCKGCKFARKKITDLQNTIKIYGNAGIK